MPAHGTSGWVEAWFSLMATSPRGGSTQQRVRPRQVETAVEGRDDRDRADPRQEQAGPLEVAVDDVELVGVVEDLLDRLLELRQRVADVADRSERLGDRRDVPSWHH